MLLTDEFVAGAAGGFVRTLVSHPFDTLKVWLQTGTPVKWQLRELYQGVVYPAGSGALIGGALIGTQRALYARTRNAWASGMVAGLVTSLLMSPVDYMKVQRQVRRLGLPQPAAGPFTGLPECAAREALSGAVFFGVFQRCRPAAGSDPAAAAVAGLCTVLATHPLDVLKTRVQSGQGLQQAVAAGGFHQGLAVCCLRAVVMNAVSWAVYERTRRRSPAGASVPLREQHLVQGDGGRRRRGGVQLARGGVRCRRESAVRVL